MKSFFFFALGRRRVLFSSVRQTWRSVSCRNAGRRRSWEAGRAPYHAAAAPQTSPNNCLTLFQVEMQTQFFVISVITDIGVTLKKRKLYPNKRWELKVTSFVFLSSAQKREHSPASDSRMSEGRRESNELPVVRRSIVHYETASTSCARKYRASISPLMRAFLCIPRSSSGGAVAQLRRNAAQRGARTTQDPSFERKVRDDITF